MIFLASPYSHSSSLVREQRYRQAEHFAAHHLARGVPLFSPIVYAHYMAITHSLPFDAATWLPLNESMLERADALWVLHLEGWERSIGVRGEIDMAARLGIPTFAKEPFQ